MGLGPPVRPARSVILYQDGHGVSIGVMNATPDTLNVHARRLGLAGLIIPIACAGAVLVDPSLRWIMLAAGFGYAAFIFSFLGGV